MNAILEQVIVYFLMTWDEYFIATFAMITASSCFLAINHAPGGLRKSIEKSLWYFIGGGSFGIAIGPLFDNYLAPSVFEMVYVAGTAVYSVWLTRDHWYALPVIRGHLN